MTQYLPPSCLVCNRLKTLPQKIGSKAKCEKYPNGIPDKIFFEAGKCSFLERVSKEKR